MILSARPLGRFLHPVVHAGASVMLPTARAPADRSAAPSPLAEPLLRPAEAVTGILLAGGRSRRMGRDKAWVELAGRPLIQWALAALRQASDSQLVVARDRAAAERLAGLGVPMVIDELAARGPLTGVHAGLRAAKTDLCLVLACDMPLVRPELLRFLAVEIGAWDAAVPYAGDAEPPPDLFAGATRARDAGLQPLLAAYRKSCLPALERILAGGPLPTMALLSLVKSRVINPELWRQVDPEGRSFLNINTHQDLELATRLLAGMG